MEWELEQMKKGGLSSGRAGRGGRVRGDNSDPALGFDRKRGRERERERERERVGGRVGDEFEMLEEVPAGFFFLFLFFFFYSLFEFFFN